MAQDQVHRHLKAVPLFSDFDRHDFQLLDVISTELRMDAGEVVMTEGKVAHEMVVVLEGTLEVTRHGEHVAEIGPGNFAGEMALLSSARRNSTVVAKTNVVLLHIDGKSFSNLLTEVPGLAVKMLPVVASRVQQLPDPQA